MSVGETQTIDGLDPAIEQIAVVRSPAPVRPNLKHLHDRTGHLTDRYGAGHFYLIRPDQHVAARFGAPDAETVNTAWKRAMSRT